MHLSFLHKYVIISITYLTPKPAKVCLGSHSLRLCIREDGGGHRPRTLPPTPFPDDASNQPTFTPYMKITACYGIENGPLQPIKVMFATDFGEAINKRCDKKPAGGSLGAEELANHWVHFHGLFLLNLLIGTQNDPDRQ